MHEEFTDEYQCPSCREAWAKRIIGAHPGGHYARIQCLNCDRFIKWEGKPGNKPSNRKNQKKLLDRFSRGFCEICLRQSAEIPLPQTLEAHHIIPVESGGNDEAGNIQIVCTHCHKWIHQQRTYLGHYRKSSLPAADHRIGIYAEIEAVMSDRGITKRAAINILNERFNANTRNDLNDEQLQEFLSILKEAGKECAA